MYPFQIDTTFMLIFLLVGVLVALPSSMVGLGGGILFIPLLLLFFQFEPNNAVAISLMAMTGNTVSCSITYAFQRRIKYKVALLYDVMDLPGVWVGAWLTVVLFVDLLVGIVAVMVFLLGFLLVRKARGGIAHTDLIDESEPAEPDGEHLKSEIAVISKNGAKLSNRPLALVSSFGSGFVSGLAGLGGGTTDTTTMILLGIPPHIAAPTSEFAMAFTNIIAVLFHALLGNMIWEAALPMMAGAILGAQVGAFLSKRVKSHILIYVLVGFAWFASIRLFISIFFKI